MLLRSAFALVVVAALVPASIVAMGKLRADLVVAHASAEMLTWNAARPAPTDASWEWMRKDLSEALQDEPGDPAIHELLGILKQRRKESPEYLDEAVVHFTKALELRPGSPYSWGNLIEARYRQGASGRDLEPLLERAARLGPWEPAVQNTVVDYGLAVWNEVGIGSKRVVENVLRAGMRRNPLAMLQISERRGRLDVACRYVSEARSAHAETWSKFCQSTESTP